MKQILTYTSLALFALTACENGPGSLKPSMYEGSHLTQRQIELSDQRHTETVPVSALSYDYLMAVTDAYLAEGTSPLYVVFGYDPNQKNARLSAHNRANITKGQLGKMDVRNAVVKTVPVIGSNGEVVIGYDKLTASGPRNCGTMPGTGVKETGAYGDYGYGCTVKDMMARQIADPRDLKGVADVGGTYGAGRAANIVNRDVRAGETNDFVPTYILSEIGSGD